MEENLIPKKLITEACIQGEFYAACREVGVNCVLEHATPVGRLDCAIFSSDWGGIVGVVEVKNGRWFGSGQRERYGMLGVPVFCLMRMCEVDGLVDKIKSELVDNPRAARFDVGKLDGVKKSQLRERARSTKRGYCRGRRTIYLDEDLRVRSW